MSDSFLPVSANKRYGRFGLAKASNSTWKGGRSRLRTVLYKIQIKSWAKGVRVWCRLKKLFPRASMFSSCLRSNINFYWDKPTARLNFKIDLGTVHTNPAWLICLHMKADWRPTVIIFIILSLTRIHTHTHTHTHAHLPVTYPPTDTPVGHL